MEELRRITNFIENYLNASKSRVAAERRIRFFSEIYDFPGLNNLLLEAPKEVRNEYATVKPTTVEGRENFMDQLQEAMDFLNSKAVIGFREVNKE